MKVIRPAFWRKFRCIGGKCTDNCCVGWEICIDRETWEKYQKLPGELGEKLRREIKNRRRRNFFSDEGRTLSFFE